MQLPVDGLVRIAALTDDYYHYDEATHSPVGSRTKKRYRLGDTVWVEVARVDVYRRRLDFRVVEEPGRERGKTSHKKTTQQRRGRKISR